MKNLNNYILNNYQKLFFTAGSSSNDSITSKQFLENVTLIKKAAEELKFCESGNDLGPQDLIKKCLAELEQQGFLNTLEGEADEYLYQVKDQRDKLKGFISQELQQCKTGKGMNFDTIYRRVANQF